MGCLLFVGFVRDVLHDVLNAAVQNGAKTVQNQGFHHHIVPQAVKLGVVDAVVFDQGVLADALLLERFPQAVISYHATTTSPLYCKRDSCIIILCVYALYYEVEVVEMKLEMFFDLMFDAINEADGMPVKEIETDSERKVYVVVLEDGSRFEVMCSEGIL